MIGISLGVTGAIFAEHCQKEPDKAFAHLFNLCSAVQEVTVILKNALDLDDLTYYRLVSSAIFYKLQTESLRSLGKFLIETGQLSEDSIGVAVAGMQKELKALYKIIEKQSKEVHENG